MTAGVLEQMEMIMNTNSALHIARKSAILLAALCSVSIAASAFASSPIKGIIVKGGCNPTPCGHCKCEAQNDSAPATDPNMPGDPVTDGTASIVPATQGMAINTKGTGAQNVRVEGGSAHSETGNKGAAASVEFGYNIQANKAAREAPGTQPATGAPTDAGGDGAAANLPVIHAMAINEKGTAGTKSNTTKKGNARTASGDPGDADADGDAASATAERHDVHPIKWTPANAARCAAGQADSNAQLPVDPKNPRCILRSRTKSNQANE